MSTFTVAITYTHTVAHVSTKMLLSIKEIIREIGLDPGQFTDDWTMNLPISGGHQRSIGWGLLTGGSRDGQGHEEAEVHS